MADIGKRIRQLREGKQLTPQEFARQLGEKVQRVKDIERGKQRPPAEFVAKVVYTFNADPNWLLSGEERGTYNKEVGGRPSREEMELLNMFRQLTSDQKAAIREALRAFASSRSRKKDTG